MRRSLCVYSLRNAVLIIGLLIANVAFSAGATGGQPASPSPPQQPAHGPGGAAAPYDHVIATRFGEPPTGYWLFEPAQARGGTNVRAAGARPLVIFLHGFTAVDPIAYQAWIEHLVRRGAVVIYPDYQTRNPLGADPSEFFPNTIAAVRAALVELTQPNRTPVDRAKVAVVGHSLGGILAVNLAAIAAAEGLPVPRAIMPVEPGGCRGCGQGPPGFGPPLAKLSAVAAETLAIVVVGEDDTVVGDSGARLIWDGLTAVPLDQRDYVILRSDDHGVPALRADHFLAQSGGFLGETDALDWHGAWKLFDALTLCAFEEKACGLALGDTSFQRSMGEWSDGVPVRPAVVTDQP